MLSHREVFESRAAHALLLAGASCIFAVGKQAYTARAMQQETLSCCPQLPGA